MPLLAAQGDFPGDADEVPPGQAAVGTGPWPRGLRAFGADHGRVGGGLGAGILGEVLFEQEASQFARQATGARFPLGEGLGRLCLVVEVEHGLGLCEPLLTKAFTLGGGRRRWLAHRHLRGQRSTLRLSSSYEGSCKNGNGPLQRCGLASEPSCG